MKMPNMPDFSGSVSKTKIVTVVGVAAAVGALVFSIISKSTINTISDSLDLSHSVNIQVNGTAAEVDEAGTYGIEYDDEGNAVETISSERSLNIVLRDGTLKLVDSTIHLPRTLDSGETDDIYVYLEGENYVQYHSSDGYVIVNDNIVIRTISAEDTAYNGVVNFETQEGSPVLIGERQVTDNTTIAVFYTFDESATEISEDDTALVEDIVNSATSNTPIEKLTLFGIDANADWAEEIIMTQSAVELIKGESIVYITPYTGSFAEGTTNTIDVSSISLTYCEAAVDTETGYVPYVYEFTADQNGYVDASSETTLKAKILSTSNGIIKNLYTTTN